MADLKPCFVIAPIGEAESDTRKRSDQILRHIISPAAKDCGYDAIRADQISEPGIITSQVIQRIVDAPLVIADLTGHNPNVFYELAIRHAIRKPLVQIIRKGEAIPFDVAVTRAVHFDHKDLDSVEDAKAEIARQIRAAERNDDQVDTPISVTLDLQSLRQSDNPEQRLLADVVAAILDLKSEISSLDRRIMARDSAQALQRLGRKAQMPSREPLILYDESPDVMAHIDRFLRATERASKDPGDSIKE